jgi:hypothetical protein
VSFNGAQVVSVEFGVVRGSLRDGASTLVPVDADVQSLLREMVDDTFTALDMEGGVALDAYEPSQEHGSASKLALPLESPFAGVLREFVGLENRPVDAGAMAEPHTITAYFCVLHDREGNSLVAIRRSASFKAVLEARLIQFIDDTLRAVSDDVFKLDRDFDIIVVNDTILINHVSAFELLAEIEEEIQSAAVENTRELEQTLPFVEFAGISSYVGDHKRAARVVAALRGRGDLSQTSVTNLKKECKRSGVQVRVENGKLVPVEGHELAFLQMLDRRRYAISLISGKWEQYEAPNRKAAGVRVEQHAAPPDRAQRASRARTRRGRA